jgi:hypothetical protein
MMIRAGTHRPAGSRVLVVGFVLAALVAAGLLLARPAHAKDFTVTNTNDSGNGSLRQAIEDANASKGKDTIKFNIGGGSGVKTILPASDLPDITDPVVIDGYSQPGSRLNSRASGPIDALILIELSGLNGGSDGLNIRASNVVVRGLAINRFGFSGISIESGTGNRIEGNFLGTDASGVLDRGNRFFGVTLDGGAKNTVGGTTPGARNLISGNNGTAVEISDNGKGGNKVQGNLMGTQKDGSSIIGGAQEGVFIDAPNNQIGGVEPGAGNVIAHNFQDGVSIESDNNTGNRILGNSIFENGDEGIDLAGNGRTLNDERDPDEGANNLQNFPLISFAESGTTTSITGTLNGTPNKKFTLQFFSNPSAEKDGKKFIGELSGETAVKTDAQGNASFTFTSLTPVPVGDQVTATATNSKGNTSEFSDPKTVVE